MRTHGYKGTDVYRLWGQIVTRCENPNAKSYRWYGARGITMDDTWRSDPKSFCDWAIAHGYKAGLEIDRIDVDGNYTPSNFKHNYKDHWGIERGTGRGWPGIVTHWMPLPDPPKEG